MKRKDMIENLVRLGLENAIADKNAMADGTEAILIRWNGKEEYYTGYDIYQPGENPYDDAKINYAKWLVENFK